YGPSGFTKGSGIVIRGVGNPYILMGLAANTQYEFYVQDSCGAQGTAPWIGPIGFKTLCTSQLSGTYTINGALPTAGTNFNNFQDVAAQLNQCGVSGPVVFNVVSGTYNEQVEIGNILGASAANTVSFRP